MQEAVVEAREKKEKEDQEKAEKDKAEQDLKDLKKACQKKGGGCCTIL